MQETHVLTRKIKVLSSRLELISTREEDHDAVSFYVLKKGYLRPQTEKIMLIFQFWIALRSIIYSIFHVLDFYYYYYSVGKHFPSSWAERVDFEDFLLGTE
jgi:hypothetical protein